MSRYLLMLEDAATFLAIALVAAVFAFSGVGGSAAVIAKIVFSVSLVSSVLSFVVRRPPIT
jgi:uncharacterized membrane protein YtjA (UPF0391 family)